MTPAGKAAILAIARAASAAADEGRLALCDVAVGWADELDAYARLLAAQRRDDYRAAVVSMAEREATIAHDLDCSVEAVRAWCAIVLESRARAPARHRRGDRGRGRDREGETP